MRFMRLRLILLIVVLLLASCSSNRFVYNRADWLINWWVSDFVDFDREQQAVFDQRLERWLAWHRHEELPRYVALLEDLSAAVATELDEEQLQDFVERGEVAWRRLLQEAVREGLPLLRSLSEQQVEQVLAEIDQRNEDFRRDYLLIDADKLARQRVERMEDALRRWTGKLTEPQRDLVQQWLRATPDSYAVFYQQRVRWRRVFAALLLERDQPGFADALMELALAGDTLLSDEERARLEHNRRAGQQLLLALASSLQDRQRQHLLAEIAQITEDIRRLSLPR